MIMYAGCSSSMLCAIIVFNLNISCVASFSLCLSITIIENTRMVRTTISFTRQNDPRSVERVSVFLHLWTSDLNDDACLNVKNCSINVLNDNGDSSNATGNNIF